MSVQPFGGAHSSVFVNNGEREREFRDGSLQRDYHGKLISNPIPLFGMWRQLKVGI